MSTGTKKRKGGGKAHLRGTSRRLRVSSTSRRRRLLRQGRRRTDRHRRQGCSSCLGDCLRRRRRLMRRSNCLAREERVRRARGRDGALSDGGRAIDDGGRERCSGGLGDGEERCWGFVRRGRGLVDEGRFGFVVGGNGVGNLRTGVGLRRRLGDAVKEELFSVDGRRKKGERGTNVA